MPKRKIGSIKQKILIEGDANLLNENEILVEDSDDFEKIFKIRTPEGDTKTYILLAFDKYISNLMEAHEAKA